MFPLSSEAQRVWQWGVTINFASTFQGARIAIFKRIQYSGVRLFHRFITTIYDLRLQEKRAGNDIMQMLHKFTLNTSYGKFG